MSRPRSAAWSLATSSNRSDLPGWPRLGVMAGIVPAIHVFLTARKTWMPATSAGMTVSTESDNALINLGFLDPVIELPGKPVGDR